ncbi:hypothetical protein B566_EDAN009293 [Ephemera danica]|nr:hypothetical protein B566_EDAN009293 [Ephemera danica]
MRLQKMASVPQGLFAARKVRANMSSGWERSLLFESRQEQQGKQQNKQEQGSSWGGRQQSGSKDNWGGASPFPKLNQQRNKYNTMTPGGSNPNVAATSSGALPARGAGPYMNPGGPGSSPAAAAPATSAPWENFLTAPEYRH